MINFVGVGSAFNTKVGNTSAYVKRSKSLILIDCGGTVFHRLQELNLLDGLENLYVIITHTHPDHIGSLGDLIFYVHYILGKKVNILFPKKEHIEGILTSLGISSEMYNINNLNRIEINDEYLGEVCIEFLNVTHVDTIPTYGFVMKLNEETFYYSGDANNIDSKIIEKFKDGEINRIYQDTCGLDYDGNAHLSLKKLCEIVPKELRNRVYCMHLDGNVTDMEIREKGFNIAKM